MATLKGTWKFNDVLIAPSADFAQDIVFVLTEAPNDGVGSQIGGMSQDGAFYFGFYSSTADENIVTYSSTEGWANEAYKTITISEEQEVSDEFYTWFTTNATEVEGETEEPETPVTVKISGSWKLNSSLTLTDITEEVRYTVNASVSGVEYVLSCYKFGVSSSGVVYHYDAATPEIDTEMPYWVHPYTISDTLGIWRTDLYGTGVKTIAFDSEQEVSEEFYAWLTANATEVEEETAKTLKGTWKFNDELTAPVGQLVNFTSHLLVSDRAWDFDIICSAFVKNGDTELNYRVMSTSEDAPEDAFTTYPIEISVYANGWTYGDQVKTVTFTSEQEVSDDFYVWFTANATEQSDDGGGDDSDDDGTGGTDDPDDPTTPEDPDESDPNSPTADTIIAKIKSLIAKANEVTGKDDVDLTSGVNSLAEGYGGGGTIVPLTVTENGVYDTYYEVATETWDSNTEYDGSVTIDGVTFNFKKAENLIVPDDLYELEKSRYIISIEADILEETLSAPMNESLTITPDIVAAYAGYAVIWVKSAAPLNEQFGISFLEDNTVYVTNYMQMALEADGASYVKASVTAPSEKVAENVGFYPVTVELPISDETLEFDAQFFGTYTTSRNEYYNKFSIKSLEPQTIEVSSLSTDKTYYPDEYHAFSEVTVKGLDLTDITTQHILCGIYIKTLPKTEYKVNEWITGQGGILLVQYTDGTTEEKDMHAELQYPNDSLQIYGFSSMNIGTFTLRVSWTEGVITSWTTYDITVTDENTETNDTIKLQEKTVTENGEVTADSGYDGLSKVIVNVPVSEILEEYDGTIVIE